MLRNSCKRNNNYLQRNKNDIYCVPFLNILIKRTDIRARIQIFKNFNRERTRLRYTISVGFKLFRNMEIRFCEFWLKRRKIDFAYKLCKNTIHSKKKIISLLYNRRRHNYQTYRLNYRMRLSRKITEYQNYFFIIISFFTKKSINK